MSKFKVSMKITGFELQIEGNRDDVPLMTQAVGQQFAGLLAPATEVVEGEIVSESANASQSVPPLPKTSDNKPKTKRRSSPRTSSESVGDKSSALDWSHDTAKYGFPLQSWTVADKCLWLLYVVSQEKSVNELSTTVIHLTYNKHFAPSGKVTGSNISRDLGRARTKQPSQVNSDTSKTPTHWSLTTAGESYAKSLVTATTGNTKL